MKRFLFILILAALACQPAFAQWLSITNVTAKLGDSEMGGPFFKIEYELAVKDISRAAPAYVFVRYRESATSGWRLIPQTALRGDHDIVESAGKKKMFWWGLGSLGLANASQLEVRVRGIRMVRVPGGAFKMNVVLGGGFDESKPQIEPTTLPTFWMAKYETTVGMYADYLNETGKGGSGWHKHMTNPERCGITHNPGDTYAVAPGREKFPINYVSWYDAAGFLDWCGLRLPSEAEWEKTLRGGLYLDGDESKKAPNPKPERKYPWGDEAPDTGGVWRCNGEGDADGFPELAPVGSFDKFNSPYGACDIVGNAAEWTLDWYSTSFHAGLDGYRMIRGGSFMDPPAGCDAVTGATQLPVKRSSITGFRGLRDAWTE
ncbi:MAG: SUMF1/EgtB/PvdO family nonheme iron enzyme [Verrucomicrobia bacterium]|nr:SUMF1/EgtB/PvdO family nonheme iron enzyme [Verrucomicrobiota bacterium]